MTFPTYTNVFTNAPIQSTFPSYLELDFTSITDATLEWVFQNQNTIYPFSNTIRVIVNPFVDNSITMPDATATSVGQETTIINSSEYSFLVRNNIGGIIALIFSTQSWQIQLVDNSTAAGVWIVVQNGASTSSATAASLIDSSTDSNTHSNAGGLGAFTTNYLKQNQLVYVFPSGIAYNQATGDRGNILVWQAGSGNYNCLTASALTNGFIFTIQNNTTTGGVISVVPHAGDTINNSELPFTISPDSACSFVSDGVSTIYSYAFSQNSVVITDLVNINLTTQISDAITLTTLEASFSIQKYINTVGSGPYSPITINYPVSTIAEYIAFNDSDNNNIIVQISGESDSDYQYTVAPGNRIFVFSDGTHLYNTPNFLPQSTISLADGSAALPSLSFTNDPTTGLFRGIGGTYVNQIEISQDGVSRMAFGTTNTSLNTFDVENGSITQQLISIYSLMRAYG